MGFGLVVSGPLAILVVHTVVWADDVEVRSVVGTVTDPYGKPIDGAVVQLENEQTLQIRSYITQNGGKYRFSGLSGTFSYELKASHKGSRSKTKRLSIFSSKKEPNVNLKLKQPIS